MCDNHSTESVVTQKEFMYQTMNQQETDQNLETEWFAIRTRREFQAAKELATLCDEIFFPTRKAVRNGAKTRESAVIPHVLFVRTNPERLLDLERQGREHPETSIPFWIYRQPGDTTIRPIPQKSIELLRLLTADDTTRCEIFTKTDYKPGQRVRVIGGLYEGYEGTVQRIKKKQTRRHPNRRPLRHHAPLHPPRPPPTPPLITCNLWL